MSPNDPVSHDNMCSAQATKQSVGQMLRFPYRQIPRHTLSCLQFNGCVHYEQVTGILQVSVFSSVKWEQF